MRNNNGALQLRARLGGKDLFINRLGRFDDPVARAKALAISAEIWSDLQRSDLDQTLNHYRPLSGSAGRGSAGWSQAVDGADQAVTCHPYLSDCPQVWISSQDFSGRSELCWVDGQEGSGAIDSVHDPEHDPIGSTEEQSRGKGI
ncbi:MAG: hypothetical protein VYE46_06650 [Cyanobacteriota bacterium]|nr:hypothetical protein [Cyanobacteriota bacterium]